MIQQANLDQIDNIAAVATKSSKELGFTRKVALQEAVKRGELLVDLGSFSFCEYHTRKDGWTVVYAICVAEASRGKGIAKEFINKIPKPIFLKCTQSNPANQFYERIGFKLVRTEPGRKQPLNIWILEK